MKSIGKGVRRAVSALGTGLLLVALASCGGGTEPVEEFNPRRYYAFGDATSVMTPLGRKYTVNGVDSNDDVDCADSSSSQPSLMWIQIIANTFRLGFVECNPAGRPIGAFIYADPTAKSTDFGAQVAKAREERGAFGCNDLMSVMLGTNDVIELFEARYLPNPTSSTANAIQQELTRRGTRLGQAIAALTDNDGPNVIVSTIPRMNQTPWGQKQAADLPGQNIASMLRTFSQAFNDALRTAIPNDGSRWGLVELDQIIDQGFNDPDDYDLTNVTGAVCTEELPFCNNVPDDLVLGANARNWLWASDRWIGWQAHSRLGNFARDRAEGNPFGCS